MTMKNDFFKKKQIQWLATIINGCDVTDLIERWGVISVDFRRNHQPSDKRKELSNT